ncbi:porin [Dyella telluris]|uniref:Porin n=1 Tax=Dyella telluris TaxID=2763498 RepID=A0A7G8QAX3_9GAMM|nr:porin [Dyella telluris]
MQDFKRVDQAWDATLRPSKIPTVSGAAGANGQSVLSVRQSRFGVKSSTPLGDDVLQTQFEFDMFGTGDNAGQTTFRLRKAYGSWGDWLAGQTNSVFMDGDSFPNVIDYWGPNGMVFIRNPQLRWGHAWGGHSFAVAIEQPGNDIDPGQIRQIDPELASQITSREKVPDLTAHYRYDGNWGHVQVATVLRDVGYQGLGTPDNRPKGDETGWGVNLTGNIKFGSASQLILAGVHGKGIASYMNDGGTDLAPGGVQDAPIAKTVPLTGLVAYFDHGWNDQWTSSIGYSQTSVTNTPFQEGTAFRKGQYASVNLLYSPFKALLVGGEFLWGSLVTKNGQSGNDSRLQISVKYSFSSNP